MMTSSSSGYTIVHKEDKIGLNAPQSLAPSTHLSAVATNTITASHILPHTIQTDPNRPSFQGVGSKSTITNRAIAPAPHVTSHPQPAGFTQLLNATGDNAGAATTIAGLASAVAGSMQASNFSGVPANMVTGTITMASSISAQSTLIPQLSATPSQQVTANTNVSSIIRARMAHAPRVVTTNLAQGATPKAAHTSMIYPQQLPRGVAIATPVSKNPTTLRVSQHAVVSIPNSVVTPPAGLLAGVPNSLNRNIVPIRTCASITVPAPRGQSPAVAPSPASVTVPAPKVQGPTVVPTPSSVTVPSARGHPQAMAIARNAVAHEQVQRFFSTDLAATGNAPTVQIVQQTAVSGKPLLTSTAINQSRLVVPPNSGNQPNAKICSTTYLGPRPMKVVPQQGKTIVVTQSMHTRPASMSVASPSAINAAAIAQIRQPLSTSKVIATSTIQNANTTKTVTPTLPPGHVAVTPVLAQSTGTGLQASKPIVKVPPQRHLTALAQPCSAIAALNGSTIPAGALPTDIQRLVSHSTPVHPINATSLANLPPTVVTTAGNSTIIVPQRVSQTLSHTISTVQPTITTTAALDGKVSDRPSYTTLPYHPTQTPVTSEYGAYYSMYQSMPTTNTAVNTRPTIAAAANLSATQHPGTHTMPGQVTSHVNISQPPVAHQPTVAHQPSHYAAQSLAIPTASHAMPTQTQTVHIPGAHITPHIQGPHVQTPHVSAQQHGANTLGAHLPGHTLPPHSIVSHPQPVHHTVASGLTHQTGSVTGLTHQPASVTGLTHQPGPATGLTHHTGSVSGLTHHTESIPRLTLGSAAGLTHHTGASPVRYNVMHPTLPLQSQYHPTGEMGTTHPGQPVMVTSVLGTPTASPRPSILRKRPTDAVFVRKNLANTLADMSGPLPDMGYSPRISIPMDPSRENSQSSTDTATSNESTPQSNTPDMLRIKPENDHDGLSGTPIGVSPRKKPRKQLLNIQEEFKDTYSTDEEIEHTFAGKIEQESEEPNDPEPMEQRTEYVDDEGVRWSIDKTRPPIFLMNHQYAWKSRHNHFQRHSEVKAKDERRPTVNELSNQKNITQKASGWKLHYLAAQLEELVDLEKNVFTRFNSVHESVAQKATEDVKPMVEDDLGMVNELTQGNIQRSKLFMDQLAEAKSAMIKILEHRQRIKDIISKHHSKRTVKKKERT